jgi:pyruvate/oxaloacetate carboxyltransferase
VRKRGATFNRARGHILTPQQVQQLVMPIHMAIELLPLGLYTEDHAHDLAAFLNIAQCAAVEAGRDDIITAAVEAVEVLAEMKHRADEGKNWNVTTAERDTLMRAVVTIDKWQRTQTTARWTRAMHKVIAACDRALAGGAKPMQFMEV